MKRYLANISLKITLLDKRQILQLDAETNEVLYVGSDLSLYNESRWNKRVGEILQRVGGSGYAYCSNASRRWRQRRTSLPGDITGLSWHPFVCSHISDIFVCYVRDR
jgi:hypothetical protein